MQKKLLVIMVAAALSFVLSQRVARAVEKGQTAPEIALKDLSGKAITLSSLKGKVVLVDFWASWCGPCRESMPFLEKLSKSYRDQGLVVLGVNIDNDAAAVVLLHAGVLEAEPLGVGHAPDRDQHHVGLDGLRGATGRRLDHDLQFFAR